MKTKNWSELPSRTRVMEMALNALVDMIASFLKIQALTPHILMDNYANSLKKEAAVNLFHNKEAIIVKSVVLTFVNHAQKSWTSTHLFKLDSLSQQKNKEMRLKR
jgi:hypothetical protein